MYCTYIRTIYAHKPIVSIHPEWCLLPKWYTYSQPYYHPTPKNTHSECSVYRLLIPRIIPISLNTGCGSHKKERESIEQQKISHHHRNSYIHTFRARNILLSHFSVANICLYLRLCLCIFVCKLELYICVRRIVCERVCMRECFWMYGIVCGCVCVWIWMRWAWDVVGIYLIKYYIVHHRKSTYYYLYTDTLYVLVSKVAFRQGVTREIRIQYYCYPGVVWNLGFDMLNMDGNIFTQPTFSTYTYKNN